MTPLSFSLLFSLALTTSVLVKLWLAFRQIRHVARHRGQVPEGFENRIDQSAHDRAARYTIARVRLGMIETLVAAITLLGLTLLGGLQALNQVLHVVLPDSGWMRALLLILLVVLLVSIIDLPLAAWRQFVLEKRFGFNRMTPGLFLSDLLRSALLTLLLAGPLLALILWLMTAVGETWWLAAWVVWLAFNLMVLVLYPVLIAPLFNRFEPLADGEVSLRLKALLARCGFAARGLFVMDGSRRSAHGNAYFTGLGRNRRIVLFDTLLERLDAEEIEAVLAHELGHFKRRHLLQRVVMSFGLSLAGLALMGWLAQQAWFFQGLGLTPAPGDHAGGLALLLFFLALPPFTFLLRPLGSALSRRHEREADDYAVQQTGSRPLARALVKLYRDNASTLTPDPLHSAFHDSHPPALQRLARLSSA
ncbi:MAG: M48 family metallopeptidase [Burkholderiaceae bacterium]